MEPQKQDTKDFVTLLQTAPPLQDLKITTQKTTRYTGVPEPPPPRRQNKIDTHLFTVESKLCTTLNILADFIENEDHTNIGLAAAFIRSAQQDIREQRRGLLAGRQAWKLDPRKDDEKTKLLTAEEEKRMKPQGKGKGKGGGQSTSSSSWYNNNNQDKQQYLPNTGNQWSSWRGRSRSRDHKGKGKGKGKRTTSESK
jgi:hypothetical protein